MMQKSDETWEHKQDHISPYFSVIEWLDTSMDKKQETETSKLLLIISQISSNKSLNL
jgi:hypothetical protein